jgi:cytoskeletal protein CcmA (bactofilin family)
MFRRGDGDDRREHAIEAREVRMSDAGVTVVGQGARLEGTVVSAGSLRVDGQVKGTITAEGDVVLSPNSQVDADVHAQNVSVAGTFKGNIVAKQKAELAKSGKVEGNVTSKVLVVAEGAVFSGQSVMDGRVEGGQPTAAERPAPAARDGSRGGQEVPAG